MSMPDVYEEVKAESSNTKRFVDLYDIDPDAPVDPLQKVVPVFDDDFFGTFTLNFLVFTKLYLNEDNEWDNTQYNASKARLIATFDKFAKYGLHIFIDGSSEDIIDADADKLDAFKELIDGMVNDLSDYGVVYGGQLEEAELKSAIDKVISDFFESTLNYNFIQ